MLSPPLTLSTISRMPRKGFGAKNLGVGFSQGTLRLHSEQLFGGLVPGRNLSGRVDRYHSGRDIRQQGLHHFAAPFELELDLLQISGHVIEGIHQHADFIVAARLDFIVPVSLGDLDASPRRAFESAP